MFLTKENGMRIVEEIKETIGRDVNIMDRTGTILASTDPKRIGQLHTIAKEILEQQLRISAYHCLKVSYFFFCADSKCFWKA